MRFVLLVILAVVAVWAIRRAVQGAARSDHVERPSAPDELISCARCGLHLPRAEAREVGGALFCSDEHARLGASKS